MIIWDHLCDWKWYSKIQFYMEYSFQNCNDLKKFPREKNKIEILFWRKYRIISWLCISTRISDDAKQCFSIWSILCHIWICTTVSLLNHFLFLFPSVKGCINTRFVKQSSSVLKVLNESNEHSCTIVFFHLKLCFL